MPGMKDTMSEFASGDLHSGSKEGPQVTSRKQAIAIGLNQARKAGKRMPSPRRPSRASAFGRSSGR